MITPQLTSLDHAKILKAMGIHSRPEDPDEVLKASGLSLAQLDQQIERCSSQILQIAQPRSVYRIMPVDQMDPELLQGRDILRLLEDCDEAVLMALTLGSGLEKALIREEVLNMSDAYIMDICASIAVEEAADDFEGKLRLQLKDSGRYLTNRFSPGYGDYPLPVQRTLLDCVNAVRAIGLTLTPTNLMVPRKSITAIMGISSRAKPDVYGTCTHCPILSKCSWRMHHTRCWEN